MQRLASLSSTVNWQECEVPIAGHRSSSKEPFVSPTVGWPNGQPAKKQRPKKKKKKEFEEQERHREKQRERQRRYRLKLKLKRQQEEKEKAATPEDPNQEKEQSEVDTSEEVQTSLSETQATSSPQKRKRSASPTRPNKVPRRSPSPRVEKEASQEDASSDLSADVEVVTATKVSTFTQVRTPLSVCVSEKDEGSSNSNSRSGSPIPTCKEGPAGSKKASPESETLVGVEASLGYESLRKVESHPPNFSSSHPSVFFARSATPVLEQRPKAPSAASLMGSFQAPLSSTSRSSAALGFPSATKPGPLQTHVIYVPKPASPRPSSPHSPTLPSSPISPSPTRPASPSMSRPLVSTTFQTTARSNPIQYRISSPKPASRSVPSTILAPRLSEPRPSIPNPAYVRDRQLPSTFDILDAPIQTAVEDFEGCQLPSFASLLQVASCPPERTYSRLSCKSSLPALSGLTSFRPRVDVPERSRVYRFDSSVQNLEF